MPASQVKIDPMDRRFLVGDAVFDVFRIRSLGLGRFVHLYQEGAHGVIVRTRSFAPDALDPKVKNFSRMNFNLAELEAGDVDKAGWPILTDNHGNITEGPGYNVFMVTDGLIRTADDRSVLQGVSRGMVFDLANELGFRSRRKSCSLTTCTPPTRRSSRRPARASCR